MDLSRKISFEKFSSWNNSCFKQQTCLIWMPFSVHRRFYSCQVLLFSSYHFKDKIHDLWGQIIQRFEQEQHSSTCSRMVGPRKSNVAPVNRAEKSTVWVRTSWTFNVVTQVILQNTISSQKIWKLTVFSREKPF